MAHGPLAGWQQEVPLAESYAFFVALRYASIRVVFFTDCEFVRNTFDRGPAHSSSGWFVYAGLWRRIWRLVEDIGEANVCVHWIPAHTSANAVDERRITGLQRICNGKADKLAKDGASLHPHDESVAQRTERSYRVVQQVGRFIGQINAKVGHRTARDTTAKPAADNGPDQRAPRKQRQQPLKHVTRVEGTRIRCARCLRSALTLSVLEHLPCRTRNNQRIQMHSLRTSGNILF